MRSIRTTLALLLVGSIVGCGLTLGLDDYNADCDDPGCIKCTAATDCGAPQACASWACVAGFCKLAPTEARAPCTPGVCDGEGKCVECVVTDDCPKWEACGSWSCENKDCVLHLDPPGTIPPQIQGDCQSTSCDGNGQIVIAIDDTDQPPTTDCQTGSCNNGKPTSQVISQGTLCNDDGGKVCNGKGSCVECVLNSHCGSSPKFCDPSTNKCFSCADGIKNGPEADVDCGGGYCAKCQLGQSCNAINDCVSSTYCADGVCCNEPCDDLCWSCNQPSLVGTCHWLPKSSYDTTSGGQSCVAQDGVACNGGGLCLPDIGQPCTGNSDCASYKCHDNNMDGKPECVKDTGDPCKTSSECYSFSCKDGFCL